MRCSRATGATVAEIHLPADCRFFDGWPTPPGYEAYFNRLYLGA